MQIPTTKTEIAKKALQMIVAAKTASIVQDQVTERTELDEDNIVVGVGAWAVGHLVAAKARPITDRIVEDTVEAYQSWRENRKKSAE
jgi:hypothetical protein